MYSGYTNTDPEGGGNFSNPSRRWNTCWVGAYNKGFQFFPVKIPCRRLKWFRLISLAFRFDSFDSISSENPIPSSSISDPVSTTSKLTGWGQTRDKLQNDSISISAKCRIGVGRNQVIQTRVYQWRSQGVGGPPQNKRTKSKHYFDGGIPPFEGKRHFSMKIIGDLGGGGANILRVDFFGSKSLF